MMPIPPIASRTFHAPEIWVILQTLGAVGSDWQVPPEIASKASAVRAAQTALRKRGLLIEVQGEQRLAPPIEALVRPAVFPQIVFVANIADNATFGKLARVVCFGWTSTALAVNWVDETNEHHFELYAPEAARDVVVNHLFDVCALDVEDAPSMPENFGPREMEREMEQMRQSVMLMAASGIQSPEQASRAMGWFVSDRRAWLMQKDEQGAQLATRIASRADIASAVSDFVHQAVAAGESVAA